MNKEIQARWFEALLSGDYPQTRGTLHRIHASPINDAGFCCLGVLCELAVADGKLERFGANYGFSSNDMHSGFPPDIIIDDYACLPRNITRKVAAMNDDNATFAEIVEYLTEVL